MPKWFHRGGTWSNHVIELGLVWLLLLPPVTKTLSRLGTFGGLVQLAFQSMLIASGNLSFLNVLTCVPAIWCLNDAFLASVFATLTALLSGLTARCSSMVVGLTTSLFSVPQLSRSAMKHISAIATTALPVPSGMNNRLPLRSLILRHTPYAIIAALLAALSVR